MFAVPSTAFALPSPVAADSVNDACKGIGLTGGDCSGNGGANRVNKLIKAVIEIITVIVGVVAVIMIIIGGLKYVTAGGDANKVASAKTTLIYAIIGLIIVALSQTIVHFVLGKV